MPTTIQKIDGKYSVRTPGGTKSYGTTKAKAKRQATLLRAIDHGWKPTGKPARESLAEAEPGFGRRQMDRATKVSENEGWAVYRIESYAQARRYGRDTRWDIIHDERFWKQYSARGTFYFVLPKTAEPRGTKIAVYCSPEIQFFGGDDTRMTEEQFVARTGLDTGIFQPVHRLNALNAESVHDEAQALVDGLLDDGLERGHVEPTVMHGGHYGKHVASKGKTAGKFKFPRNFKVGHAIKN